MTDGYAPSCFNRFFQSHACNMKLSKTSNPQVHYISVFILQWLIVVCPIHVNMVEAARRRKEALFALALLATEEHFAMVSIWIRKKY